MYKNILILTKSLKRKALCVAGIDVATGEWVRIVTDDDATEHAVIEQDMEYNSGEYANVLDVVRIKFIEHVPSEVQPENWMLDRTVKWEKVGVKTVNAVIESYLDEVRGVSFI